jgi:hypothetical protein
MTVYRYIELNPVRAAMVEHPEKHCWSSVHANLGLLDDPLVTPHSVYTALDHGPTIRTAIYRNWLHAGATDDDLQRIRIPSPTGTHPWRYQIPEHGSEGFGVPGNGEATRAASIRS